MTVPQLTGNTKAIKLLTSSEAVKNLGLFVMPDGCIDRHMLQMEDRMEDWTVRVKKRCAADPLDIDQLQPPTMVRPKVWFGSLISNNERLKGRSRILGLLPHQRPWRHQVNKDRMEIPPSGILQDGLLQSCNRDRHSKSQLLSPALQYRLGARDYSLHNPGKSPTGTLGQRVPSSLRL